MKVVPHKCLRDYGHFFVREDTTWDESIDPDDDSQMRELLLVCARCSYHLWIDSIVRSYPWPLEDPRHQHLGPYPDDENEDT